MTGIRIGYLVTPRGRAQTMRSVQEASISCVSTPGQYAAIAAITGSQQNVTDARAHYQENIAAATALLDTKGIEYLRPAGTFYLWVRVDHASNGDVAEWAERFLLEERVAISPGSAFGRTGEGWIRVSLAADRDVLLAGLDRLPTRVR
jgi:aspartate aminotransferase